MYFGILEKKLTKMGVFPIYEFESRVQKSENYRLSI